MASLVNILSLTLDHSLYKQHIRKVIPTAQRHSIVELSKWNWHDSAPFKTSLAVLYGIVWIWGLTGKHKIC